MKKLDKLILGSFLGPFILTFLVVDFILLTQYMMKYFDELVGKSLGFAVYAELLFYFSINMSSRAFPLAVLLSSLMTFGNLGEHFELTAIKGAGISLLRAMRPIFFFVLALSAFVYYSNDNLVPRANLKAYSLLYDIRHTKPSLDIREGIFYNGIPKYSIKVNKKYPDDITLKDLIIYDHSKGFGNSEIIIADSGRMYTFFNERYLMLEMFDGNKYSESRPKRNKYNKEEIRELTRINFDSSKMVFSLSSFDFKQTHEELFASNRLMKNSRQLLVDLDSLDKHVYDHEMQLYKGTASHFSYHLTKGVGLSPRMKREKAYYDSLLLLKLRDSLPGKKEMDSVNIEKEKGRQKNVQEDDSQTKEDESVAAGKRPARILAAGFFQNVDSTSKAVPGKFKSNVKLKKTPISRRDALDGRHISLDSLNAYIIKKEDHEVVLKNAVTKARQTKSSVGHTVDQIWFFEREINKHHIELYKKLSEAVACLIMFLVGAPLGAIIKRGGLGVPVILSIVFFIIYYVFTIIGAKWSKEGLVDPLLGIWQANIVLLPIGLFFLRQARNDARLLEADFYSVIFSKIEKRIKKFRKK